MMSTLQLHVKIEAFLPSRASSKQYQSIFAAFAGAYERRAKNDRFALPLDVRFNVSDAVEGWTYGTLGPAEGATENHSAAFRWFLEDWADALTAPRDGRQASRDSLADIAAQLDTVADMPGAELRLLLAPLGGQVDGEVILHLSHEEASAIRAKARGRLRPN